MGSDTILKSINRVPKSYTLRATQADGRQDRVNELGRQIKKIEERQQRLLGAIETGITMRRGLRLKAKLLMQMEEGK